jgi:hypothetical protein
MRRRGRGPGDVRRARPDRLFLEMAQALGEPDLRLTDLADRIGEPAHPIKARRFRPLDAPREALKRRGDITQHV